MKDEYTFGILKSLVSAIIVMTVIVVFAISFSSLALKNDEKALSVISDAVRKTAITCYAIEGRYPESYEYLVENYGLYFDAEKYTVYYSMFASNIMPDIEVIKK